MEDVLSVYARPRDLDRPLVCLDETSKQLAAETRLPETRLPIAMKRGRPIRVRFAGGGRAPFPDRYRVIPARPGDPSLSGRSRLIERLFGTNTAPTELVRATW